MNHLLLTLLSGSDCENSVLPCGDGVSPLCCLSLALLVFTLPWSSSVGLLTGPSSSICSARLVAVTLLLACGCVRSRLKQYVVKCDRDGINETSYCWVSHLDFLRGICIKVLLLQPEGKMFLDKIYICVHRFTESFLCIRNVPKRTRSESEEPIPIIPAIDWSINCWFIYSIDCQRIVKNALFKKWQLQLTSLLPPTSQTRRLVMYRQRVKEKHHILTFKKHKQYMVNKFCAMISSKHSLINYCRSNIENSTVEF